MDLSPLPNSGKAPHENSVALERNVQRTLVPSTEACTFNERAVDKVSPDLQGHGSTKRTSGWYVANGSLRPRFGALGIKQAGNRLAFVSYTTPAWKTLIDKEST